MFDAFTCASSLSGLSVIVPFTLIPLVSMFDPLWCGCFFRCDYWCLFLGALGHAHKKIKTCFGCFRFQIPYYLLCVCVCVCLFFGSLGPTLSFSEISFTCLGEVSKKVFRGCPCRVKCQLTYPYFSTDIIWVL